MIEDRKIKVEAYLDNSLSEAERTDFEKELLVDVALKRELEFQKDMLASFKATEDLAVKEELTQMWKEIKTSPQKETPIKPINAKKNWKYYVLRAAAVGILLVSSWWVLTTNNPGESTDYLVDDYIADKYHSPIYQKDNTTDNDTDWENAIRFYQEEKFDQSILSIERLLKKDKGTSEQHFYLGLSYLYQKSGDKNKALEHFEKIIQKKDALYSEQALWFISLTFLKMGNSEKGKEYLQKIIDNKTWKFNEAKQLLKSII